MGDSMNPFAVLGVDEAATEDEIVAAYRARAKVLHPDGMWDGRDEDRAMAAAAMAELTHAYQLLTDEKVRKRYRRLQKKRRQAAARRGEQLPRHPSWDAAPPGDLVEQAGPPEPVAAAPPPPPAPRNVYFSGTYRDTAVAEFAVDDRSAGTPWVAPRRFRLLRRPR